MGKLQRRIQINVRAKDGSERPVVTGRIFRTRERFLRLLFGEAREILILKPGEAVDSMTIKETEE